MHACTKQYASFFTKNIWRVNEISEVLVPNFSLCHTFSFVLLFLCSISIMPHNYIKSSSFTDYTVTWRYSIRDIESAFNFTRIRVYLWKFSFNLDCVLKVLNLTFSLLTSLCHFFRCGRQIPMRCTFFILTDSIQMKGAHNCVRPLSVMFLMPHFTAVSPQTIQFS